MTTLEKRQVIKQENPIDPSMYNARGPSTTSSSYENMDAQVYSQMPPFLMQGQQPAYMEVTSPPLGIRSENTTAPSMPMPGNDSGGWPQQQQHIDQLFGEDWGGWMNQGYRQ